MPAGESYIESDVFSDYIKRYRGMEQLVARRAHNPKVAGSSPAPATKRADRIK